MKTLKGLIGIFVVIFCSGLVQAQQSELDSLKQVLETEITEDIVRVERLHEVASLIYRRNPREAQPYLFEALEISNQIGDLVKEGASNRLLGVTYAFLGMQDSALVYFERALSLFTELENQLGMATTNQAIGTIYAMQGNYEGAISRILDAIPHFEALGDSIALGVSYFNIANMYNEQELHEEALIRLEKAFSIYDEAGIEDRLPRVYTALVITNERLGRLDEALSYLETGIEFSNRFNDILSLRNLHREGGRIYVQKEEYEEAKYHTERALDLNNRTGANPIAKQNIVQQLAIIEFGLGRTVSAKQYIEEVINSELINTEGRERLKVASLELYADIEAELGNGLKAHELIKEAKVISDSLAEAENARKIAELETIYETEKRIAQIELLEIKNEAANLRLLLTIIFSVILIASISGWYIISTRRKSERKKRELGELKRELDNYGTLIAEKNKFMAKLQENLEELKIDAKSFQTKKGLLNLVDSVSQNIQLTDQEENLFKRIDQVNAGFFLKLRKISDEITQHDERLASLVQMGLSNKEIGPILGISPRSVNQARYRLKKKLQLEPEVDLIEYLKKIAAWEILN